jgi:folate-binding protein YgfZ
MPACLLEDRGVLRVVGSEARAFLQRIVTCDMAKVAPMAPAFGALLTPQGKILVDFIVSERGKEEFLLDCDKEHVGELKRRLAIYRLRANAQIDDLSHELGVAAVWNEPHGAHEFVGSEPDPRVPALGFRLVDDWPDLRANPGLTAEPQAYEAQRISAGAPKGGPDFVYGDAFPHEANMDRLNGIDFQKGCYVGQEVVSRVEHRGLARRRTLRVKIEGMAPEPGAPIYAGDTEVGVMGSSVANIGLAMLRVDRVKDAQNFGATLSTESGTRIVADVSF